MMFVRRRFFLGLFLLLAAVAAGGCARRSGDGPMTYVPDTVSFVATYKGFSAEEKRLFGQHVYKFPPTFQGFLYDIPSQLLTQLSLQDISTTNDLLPLLADDFSLTIAAAPPMFYLVLTVPDASQLDGVRSKLVHFSEKTQDGVSYFLQDQPGIAVAFFGNILLATSTEAAMQEAIAARAQGRSVAMNKDYKTLQGSVGDEPLTIFVLYREQPTQASVMRAAAAAIHFEPEGIRFLNHSLGDAKALADAEFSFTDLPEDDVSLAGLFPADNIVLYTEGGNLAKEFGFTLGFAVQGQPQFQTILKQAQAGLALAGLSYKKDIAPWLARYGLGLYRAGGVMPGIVLMLDAKGHADAAQKTLGTVQSLLGQFLSVAGTKIPLAQETVLLGGGNFSRLSFDVKAFREAFGATLEPRQAFLFQSLPDTLELFIGMTEDQKVIVALYPNFAAVYGQSALSDFAPFVAAQQAVAGYRRGILFVYPKTFADFLSAAMQPSSDLPAEEQQKRVDNTERIQSFLKPIESFVSSSRARSKTELETAGFLRLVMP